MGCCNLELLVKIIPHKKYIIKIILPDYREKVNVIKISKGQKRMLNFRYECTNLRTNLIFDHYLTTTENLPKSQIRISIPVHFAFSTVISDIRKPPKEQFPWRFWCARLDSNQRSRLPARSVLNGPRRGPRPYRVVVIRPSKKKPRFHAGFRYIAQN